jgi:hypothetical protein
MINELPYAVEKVERLGVPTVQQFFEEIANGTAAAKSQIEHAMAVLHSERQIDILSPSGALKRNGAKTILSDRVQLTRQLTFSGMKLPR